jgi:hypothetical protein
MHVKRRASNLQKISAPAKEKDLDLFCFISSPFYIVPIVLIVVAFFSPPCLAGYPVRWYTVDTNWDYL